MSYKISAANYDVIDLKYIHLNNLTRLSARLKLGSVIGFRIFGLNPAKTRVQGSVRAASVVLLK